MWILDVEGGHGSPWIMDLDREFVDMDRGYGLWIWIVDIDLLDVDLGCRRWTWILDTGCGSANSNCFFSIKLTWYHHATSSAEFYQQIQYSALLQW